MIYIWTGVQLLIYIIRFQCSVCDFLDVLQRQTLQHCRIDGKSKEEADSFAHGIMNGVRQQQVRLAGLLESSAAKRRPIPLV